MLLQIQIVNILCETARLPKASRDFSKAHGILTWILQLTEKRCIWLGVNIFIFSITSFFVFCFLFSIFSSSYFHPAAKILFKNVIVVWLMWPSISGRNVDRRMLTIVLRLLHTLWFSNLGKTDSSVQCLSYSLINDFLCTMLSVIGYLR